MQIRKQLRNIPYLYEGSLPIQMNKYTCKKTKYQTMNMKSTIYIQIGIFAMYKTYIFTFSVKILLSCMYTYLFIYLEYKKATTVYHGKVCRKRIKERTLGSTFYGTFPLHS